MRKITKLTGLLTVLVIGFTTLFLIHPANAGTYGIMVEMMSDRERASVVSRRICSREEPPTARATTDSAPVESPIPSENMTMAAGNTKPIEASGRVPS